MLTIFLKRSLIKVVSDFLHHIVVEKQIMRNGEPHSEHLLGFEQMPKISFGEAAADRA